MKKTIVGILALLLAIAVLIAVIYAIPDGVDMASLVGSYTANVEGQIHYLVLNADGTYTHKFTGPDGQNVRNSGSWTQDNFDGEARVTFEDFTTGIPRLDDISIGAVNPRIVNPGRGTTSVHIEKPFIGPIRLVVS